MKNIDIENITRHFSDKPSFEAKELYKYFLKQEPKLKESTFHWRLYSLKQSAILMQVKRGYYTLQKGKTLFEPLIDKKIIKLSMIFSKSYPELNYCCWSSAWLHDYMVHQPNNHFYIFETEKDILESSFHLFRDNKINVFINPGYNQMINYVSQNEGNVILKPLISRSHLKEIGKTKIPSIEKILVDIFCDDQTYYYYQGSELVNIFEWIISKHQVNFTTLQYYAGRRKRREQIKDFLIQKVEIDKNLVE
jgi:hypothetical protein